MLIAGLLAGARQGSGTAEGVGLELGARTFAARLNLSASGGGHTAWPFIELDLGFPF